MLIVQLFVKREEWIEEVDDCRSLSRLMSITISIMNIIIIDYHNKKGVEREIKVKGEKIEKDEYQ